jgi:hypothetical protein
VTREVAYLIALAAAVAAGWLLPALAVRSLAPSLAGSRLVAQNFRDRQVFLGLGLVWAVWAVSLLVFGMLFEIVAAFWHVDFGSPAMLLLDGPLTLGLYALPFILTVGVVLFGLVDDAFGTGEDRGFRGHLNALASGRLTTGGLKMLGVGALAAYYGWGATAAQATGVSGTNALVRIGWWVAATLVIALSANFVNLTDLRPGRALKVYVPLALVAGVVFATDAMREFGAYASGAGVGWTVTDAGVSLACFLVVLLGPVVAVWGPDLGERGMLGDAGSNAMGAIVGYLLVGSLPVLWLAGVAAVLLGLNVLSERVSFTSIIERTALLRRLDEVGRSGKNGDV